MTGYSHKTLETVALRALVLLVLTRFYFGDILEVFPFPGPLSL